MTNRIGSRLCENAASVVYASPTAKPWATNFACRSDPQSLSPTGCFRAVSSKPRLSPQGRYRQLAPTRSSRLRGGEGAQRGLRPLYLVQLTITLTSATKPNGCLMSVSVSSPSEGQRPQPLRVRQSSQTGEELHWVDPGECQALRSWPASGVERSLRQRTIDQTSELDLALR